MEDRHINTDYQTFLQQIINGEEEDLREKLGDDEVDKILIKYKLIKRVIK